MSVVIVNASIDENGKAKGGVAGDQNGKEVLTRNWYNRPWGAVLRYPDGNIAAKAAEAGVKLAKSVLVGYDQNQRNTLYQALKKNDWDVDKYLASGVKTECDCSSFVYACYCLFVPSMRSDATAPRTANMMAKYKAWGFKCFTDSSYTTKSNLLCIGDIVMKASDHTAMVCAGAPLNTTSAPTATPVKPTTTSAKVIATATCNGSMRVRTGPSVDDTCIGIIHKTEKIEILDLTSNNWYKIVYPAATEGYAYTSNALRNYINYTPVASKEEEKPAATPVVNKEFSGTVTASALNIRKESNATSTILGLFHNGDSVKLTSEEANGFGKLADREGWVCLKYIQKNA